MKVARGSALMLLHKLIARGVGLAGMLVLARVLTPADFGLVAMATSVVALIELAGAFGFDTAIIQRKDVRRTHYDTAWTFNVICGAVIGVLIGAASAPAAEFFREPRLLAILPLLAIGALIASVENPGVIDFRKQLQFDKEFRFLVLRQVPTIIVTIPLALALRSYWALVAGVLAGKLLTVVASFALHPFRPRFSLAEGADLLDFSKWLFIANVVGFLQNRSTDVVLGRVAGPAALGLYNVAFEIAVTPSTELIAPVNRAVFPAYAKLADDRAQLTARFLDIFSLIALIAFPFAVGLACIAGPLIKVVLGSQWIDAIPLLQLFTIAGLVGALQSNVHLMLIALGQPRLSTLVTTATVLSSLPVLVFASVEFGVIGAAAAYLAFTVAGLLAINAVFIRVTRIALRSYAGRLWRPLLSSSAMAAVVVTTDALVFENVGDSGVALLTLVSTGVVAYVSSSIALWHMSGRPAGAESVVLDFVRRRNRSTRADEHVA